MPTSRLPKCAKLGVVGVTSADPSWGARPVQGGWRGRGRPPVPGNPESQGRPCLGLTRGRAGTPPPQAIAHPAASSEAPAARVGARGGGRRGQHRSEAPARALRSTPGSGAPPVAGLPSDPAAGGQGGGSPVARELRGARPEPRGRRGRAGGPARGRWALRPGRSRGPPEPPQPCPRAPPQPGRDVIAGPRRGAPRPPPAPRARPAPRAPAPGMLRPPRPRGDAPGPGGAGGARWAGPPPPPPPAPRRRRGCARGLRAGRGGGARGGRGRLPAADCPPGRRLLSHGQRCPQPGLIRTARRARVRSHWAGAGPRAPGMTR